MLRMDPLPQLPLAVVHQVERLELRQGDIREELAAAAAVLRNGRYSHRGIHEPVIEHAAQN